MRIRALPIVAVVLAACGDAARVAAPDGAADFARFVTIGTGLTMGEQGGGVVYESQIAAWPARLAARVDAPFRVPAFRTPGCTPPLVAPLALYRTLGGAAGDTEACGGSLGAAALPANNVAIAGATAWDALHTSPRSLVTQPASLDKSRYALVLPAVQSQLQAMQGQRPTLVAVELGSGEVLRALRTGLVIRATSYTQAAAWTVMPAAAFAPVFDSIADSVKATGARAVFLGVPSLTLLPAWRAGDVLWQQRTALAGYGITVAPDCQASGNLVNTVALIPPLVAAARATGAAQPLSCADRPGEADHILTATDVTLIEQVIAAINAAIRAAAEKRGIPYVDVPLLSREIPYAAPSFTAAGFLDSDAPFGMATSLDGMQFSPYGHELLADRVAGALNQKYGWAIPVPPRPL